MKRVLIITYYWPPTGGSGVQRWLKFTKYLRDFGWEPVIYTPSNPEMSLVDETLMKDIPEGVEVIKQPIWEPYDWYRRILGKKDEKISAGMGSTDGRKGLAKKLAIWLRGNLFIPDPRKFWVKPSVDFLTNYLKNNPVHAVVTTSPPHSMQLIGLKLKQKLGIKWIADFRDPWTNLDFYQDLMLSSWADAKHRRLEQAVLTNADLVLSVGDTLSQELRDLGGKEVRTITNGFDREDFPKVEVQVDEKFTLSHIGAFSPSRNHIQFWNALKELCQENPAFKGEMVIRTVGQVDHTVATSIKRTGLEPKWEKIDHVSHSEVLKYQLSSRVLLLMINDSPNAKGILPGKFFEYMASGRPILCIGPTDGDSAKIIEKTGAGIVVDHNDKTGLKAALLKLWDMEKEAMRSDNIEAYSRKELTRKLSEVLNELASK